MELYMLFIMIIATNLITLFFILSLLLPFTFRRRKIQKIQFLDLDRSTKVLGAWDFFYSILKMENVSKAFHYTEILFLVVDGLFVLIGIYVVNHGGAKLSEVSIDLKDTMLLLFIEPIILWLITLFLFLFAMYMKKKENKRITEMLNNLENIKHLKFAKEDFLRSDRILATGVVSMSDIKLGDRYLFSVYPAYIIPYIYIQKMGVERFYRRGGSIYYLDIILKRSFQNIKIYFAKKDVAEKVREFILERNKDLSKREY